MKKLVVLFFAAVGLVTPAFGQQDGAGLPPLPDGPLVRLRAPEVSRWMITYNPQRGGTEATEGSAAASSFSKRVVYTKDKDLILEQSLVPTKPVRSRWIIGEYQYSKDERRNKYLPYTASSFPTGVIDPHYYVDFRKSDFPGFEWITKENYAGLQKVMKRDCIVYRQMGDGNATAYVDLASRYPVLLRKGNDTMLYEFQQPARVSVPAEIQEDLKTRLKAAKP